MIIQNAALPKKEGLWNIHIKNGTFSKIERACSVEGALDVEGKLVSAPFVEPHIHLDTTLTAGEPKWNESGTLFEGIETWTERKKTLTKADVKKRAMKALQWQIAQGIQAVRTHVDVCDPSLTALKALLEVKEEMKDFVDIQLVAFPQEGFLSYSDGTEL
ncbi:MAG: amidohydrolase family protein, partial [Alkalibacterium sp.]|uniref:amidohydrolase family protein n=1 Tax=Alkalibacterium sp. TaxID=1872447 RepID=UPI0039706BDF